MGDFQTSMSLEELRRRNEESQAEAERRRADNNEKEN